MEIEDEAADRVPIWLRTNKPKRKRKRLKPVPNDELTDQKLSDLLPKEKNLSLYELLYSSIESALEEKPRSFQQLLRLAIHAIRSREEVVEHSDFRFDDNLDDDAIISKLVADVLAVMETIGLVKSVKLNAKFKISEGSSAYIPGYELSRAQQKLVQNIDEYIELLVGIRNEDDSLRREEARYLNELARHYGITDEIEVSNLSREESVASKKVESFLPGRVKLISKDLEAKLIQRQKLNRSHEAFKKRVDRSSYSSMAHEAREIKKQIKNIQSDVYRVLTSDGADETLTLLEYKPSKSRKDKARKRNSKAMASALSKITPRSGSSQNNFIGMPSAPQGLQKSVQPPSSACKENGLNLEGSKPIRFDEITCQFKVVGHLGVVEAPTSPRSPTISRLPSVESLASISSAVDVDTPSFREYDFKKDKPDGLQMKEDLSDKNFLKRHSQTIDAMRKKWIAMEQRRKELKQQARERREQLRHNKSPRAKKEYPKEMHGTLSIDEEVNDIPVPSTKRMKAQNSKGRLIEVVLKQAEPYQNSGSKDENKCTVKDTERETSSLEETAAEFNNSTKDMKNRVESTRESNESRGNVKMQQLPCTDNNQENRNTRSSRLNKPNLSVNSNDTSTEAQTEISKPSGPWDKQANRKDELKSKATGPKKKGSTNIDQNKQGPKLRRSSRVRKKKIYV